MPVTEWNLNICFPDSPGVSYNQKEDFWILGVMSPVHESPDNADHSDDCDDWLSSRTSGGCTGGTLHRGHGGGDSGCGDRRGIYRSRCC